MTHRTYTIAGCLINVFDSRLGAEKYMKRHATEDYSVLLRGKAYFLRRGQLECSINLNADAKHDRGHLIAAAQEIAREIETKILDEKLELAHTIASQKVA